MSAGPAVPEVSVVVPARDAAATLPDQLAALAEQHADFPWEVLVCDNASTDGTAQVVTAWSDRLPRLARVPVTDRRGAGAARNVGAQRAGGRYLAFCDADDVVAPGWLAALRSGLETADLVVGLVEPARLNTGRRPTVSWETQPPIRMPWWPEHPAGATNNMAVDAEAFAAVGGFDESLETAEDVDLCWRLQLAGFTLAVEPAAVVHVRKRSGLRSVYRQAYTYGAGGSRLRDKYADRADRYWRERGLVPPRAASGVAELAYRTLRSAARGRAGDAAWRLGEWAGSRRRS